LTANSLLAGRYLIGKKVGEGGMGAVYHAKDRRLGDKVVAIKEMSEVALTDLLEKQQARFAFQQEAQMLAELNHANLPRVTDHFNHGSKQYLVMDFIEGHSLHELLQQASGKPQEVKKVVAWAKQLCDVLDYLHNQKKPIVFRDLKPANIMIAQGGQVKLIDFGIARFFKKGKSTDTSYFGTAGYAPPEQYGGKGQTDPRTDIYALGATLHHLLTGYDPIQSPFNLPPVPHLNPKVPKALSQTIMRALEHNPKQRWQSAREMKLALLSEATTRPQGLILSKPKPFAPARPTRIVPALAASPPKAPYLRPAKRGGQGDKPTRRQSANDRRQKRKIAPSPAPPQSAVAPTLGGSFPARSPIAAAPIVTPRTLAQRSREKWRLPLPRLPRPRLPSPSLPKFTLKRGQIITFAIIGGLIGRALAASEGRANIEEFVFAGFLAGAFFGLIGWSGLLGGLIGAAIAQQMHFELAQGLGIGIVVGILLGKRGWGTIMGALIGAGLGYIYAPTPRIALIGAVIGAFIAFRSLKKD
jgi:serine/threonine protein kinase